MGHRRFETCDFLFQSSIGLSASDRLPSLPRTSNFNAASKAGRAVKLPTHPLSLCAARSVALASPAAMASRRFDINPGSSFRNTATISFSSSTSPPTRARADVVSIGSCSPRFARRCHFGDGGRPTELFDGVNQIFDLDRVWRCSRPCRRRGSARDRPPWHERSWR